MAKDINHLATADGLFFGKGALDLRKTGKTVDEALKGCDDGELFLEYVQSESLAFDDGKLKSASYDTTQGFGLRAVSGEVTGFSHASALDEKALKRAADTVKAVRAGKGGTSDKSPRGTNRLLYADDNPIDGEGFEKKVKLLQEIDAYVRGKEPKAKQVSISLAASWQVVEIIRAGGWRAADVRPLVRLNVSVVCADGSRMEFGLDRLAAGAPPTATSSSPTTGSARPTRRSARRWSISTRSRRRPARCRWCWARAGRACCGTRPWATGWKATSIARRPRCSAT